MDDGTVEDKGNFAFRFGLRQLGELKRRLLIIVDEASVALQEYPFYMGTTTHESRLLVKLKSMHQS